jgi:hypothetical protein
MGVQWGRMGISRDFPLISILVEGSLEVKHTTKWTDGKAEMTAVREEKESEEKKSEEKESVVPVERRSRCAKR